MQDTWIVCYFGIALGLDERIINSFHFLELFELRTCKLFFEKITRKLHARSWGVKASPGLVDWMYCWSPTGNYSFEMGYVYTANLADLTVERYVQFHLQCGLNVSIFEWRFGYKIKRGGHPITFDELETQIMSFIKNCV